MDADRYHLALTELLMQLADDDLVVATRAGEWLGLAPHLEEDVAFSSIAQDEMGHAATYFTLLATIHGGDRDDLAHLRPALARRNSVMLERPNGRGTYRDTPHFDWAYALARHFFYDTLEMARLDRLVQSAHRPLAEAAAKIRREERYHNQHHSMWLRDIARSGPDVGRRVELALDRAAADAVDLASAGPMAAEMETFGLLPDASHLTDDWRARVAQALDPLGWALPPLRGTLNGRHGEHTQDLTQLLQDLGEVYRSSPGASW